MRFGRHRCFVCVQRGPYLFGISTWQEPRSIEEPQSRDWPAVARVKRPYLVFSDILPEEILECGLSESESVLPTKNWRKDQRLVGKKPLLIGLMRRATAALLPRQCIDAPRPSACARTRTSQDGT